MKRLHVHISVEDLDQAARFYSGLFGVAATTQKDDYAQWRLDDPLVNFAIAARGKGAGIEHLGFDVEDAAEFDEVRDRRVALDGRQHDQEQTTCRYAVSDKSWIEDPAGVSWELFRTTGRSSIFGDDGPSLSKESESCGVASEEAAPSADSHRCCGP